MPGSWSNTISAMRSRFSRLRTQRSKAPAVTGPLGLSPPDLEALDHLRSTPAWRHYSQAMEAVYNQQLSALIRPLAHDGYLFQCGVVFALERAATLVDDLLIARDNHARVQPKQPSPDARAFLGTPWWNDYTRTKKS